MPYSRYCQPVWFMDRTLYVSFVGLCFWAISTFGQTAGDESPSQGEGISTTETNAASSGNGFERTDSRIASSVTLKLGTIADVTVDEGAITRNFGDENYLGVGGDKLHHRQSFLMFYIKGPGKILSVKLKMMAGEVNTVDTTVHAVNDVSWGEDELTWKSRPEMGATLGTLTNIVPGKWHEWDVSDYVKGPGFLALGLTSTDTRREEAARNWCSREQDRNLKPYLEVTFDNVYTPPAQQDPFELEFFQPESQPRMLDFRGMQNPAVDGMNYRAWDAAAALSQGIIGKALYENEKTQDFMPNCEAYYTEYKKNHPEKLAMIHISANGRLRTPGNISSTPFQTDDFFPGHWLYFQGQRLTRDIGAEEVTIFVEDVMYFKKNDVVGIFELSEGKIQWRKNEYVLVKGIDKEHNSLKVLRGQFATPARNFTAGSYVAAVATAMYPETWRYNLARSCPKDEAGKTCLDRVMELYAEWLAPGGYFEGMNGIALDVDVFYSEKNNRRPGWRHHDVNGDQTADAGFINGVNDYGLGKLDFHQRLRDLLGPDRMISGDITSAGEQRSVAFLNGGESEIFPHQGDNEYLRLWSNGVNKFGFWMSNAVEPRYCYSPIKESKLKEKALGPVRLMRLHNAAVQLLGAASGVQPLKKDGRIFDEMVKGVAQQPNWLGAKVGDTLRPGLHTPDLLSGAGTDLNADFVNAWSSGDALISKVGNELKIAGRSGNQNSMVATFKSVALPAGSLLVAFDVRAEPRPDYPDHLPRLVWVSADEASHLCVLPPKSMHFTYGMTGIPEMPLNVLSLSIDNPEIIDTSFSTRCDAYWKNFKDGDEEYWGYMVTLPSWKLDDAPWVAWSKTVQLPSASCELVLHTYTGPNPWRSGLGAVQYDVFIGGEKVHSSENDASKWMRKTVDLSNWAGQEITLRFVASPGATYKNGNPVWGPTWIAPKGQTPYIRPDDLAAHQLLTYAQ
jgi:hypothetical protein